jgi:hypothetical protein
VEDRCKNVHAKMCIFFVFIFRIIVVVMTKGKNRKRCTLYDVHAVIKDMETWKDTLEGPWRLLGRFKLNGCGSFSTSH